MRASRVAVVRRGGKVVLEEDVVGAVADYSLLVGVRAAQPDGVPENGVSRIASYSFDFLTRLGAREVQIPHANRSVVRAADESSGAPGGQRDDGGGVPAKFRDELRPDV